jgi:hypothetical protein
VGPTRFHLTYIGTEARESRFACDENARRRRQLVEFSANSAHARAGTNAAVRRLRIWLEEKPEKFGSKVTYNGRFRISFWVGQTRRAAMKRWVIERGALIGGLCLVACGPTSTDDDDESTASDLAALATSNVEQALRGTHRAGSFIADSATIADALGSFSGSSEYCTTSCSVDGVCETVCVDEEDPLTVADLQEGRADLDEAIDDMVENLKEKIFTAENLESSSGGTATYLLGPKVFCSSSSSSLDPVPSSGGTGSQPAPEEEPMLDQGCVDEFNRLQPRLRLSSPSTGNVDVALLLTSSRKNPVTLELHSNHLGLVIDLGETKATLDAAGEDTGSITQMAGKLGFEIRKNGELDYSLRANVVESVALGSTDDAGDEIQYGVGASVPTMELRLDGNAREITGSIDYGAITLSGSLNAFRDTFDPPEYDPLTGENVPRPTYTGAVEAMLAGVEGSATFDGSTDKLTLSHLGLGDASSTLKFDGQTLAQLDLNPSAGRHFDMTVEQQTGGSVVTFSPTLDASALLNFAPLAAQITDISPELLNNALHFWFDGTNPSVKSQSDQLAILSGTMHFTNAYDPTQDFTATAGQCVSSADVDASANEGVTGVLVTTCQ